MITANLIRVECVACMRLKKNVNEPPINSHRAQKGTRQTNILCFMIILQYQGAGNQLMFTQREKLRIMKAKLKKKIKVSKGTLAALPAVIVGKSLLSEKYRILHPSKA